MRHPSPRCLTATLRGVFGLVAVALAAVPARAQVPDSVRSARGIDTVQAEGARSGRRVVTADSLARAMLWRDTLRVSRPMPWRLRPGVDPATLVVVANGRRLDSTAFRLDVRTGRLWLQGSAPLDLVQLVAVYATRDAGPTARYGQPGIVRRGPGVDSTGVLRGFDDAAPPPPEAPALRRSGAITRGVLAGTNRDVALESSLRVQLDGEIAPGVRVEAALTDANTPILADGTTQRLSEFDRVALSVTTRTTTARLGDVDLALGGGDLARLSRKVQGASVETRLGARGAFGGGRVVVAGAASRGLYRVQQFVPVEGVQGPYRLDGAAGEPYVLVLPGSEIVYVNGERMERDRGADYTIDYAAGEVTFTSRRLLRATDRVTVEFQYNANPFPRSLFAARVEGMAFGTPAAPRLRFGVSGVREADANALPAALDLSDDDAALVRASGDGVAFRDGATRLPRYEPEAPFVQYRREARPGGDTVYVALDAAPAADEPVFRVRFTRRGPGQGAYVRAATTLSGIAYRYEGPGRGDYDPVRLLPKPRSQTLAGVQVEARPLGGLTLRADLAASRLDENRLSRLDEADDGGRAGIVGLSLDERRLGGRWGRASAFVTHEDRTAAFTPFERSRPADFEQRWNLPAAVSTLTTDLALRVRETTTQGGAVWSAGPALRVEAEGGRLALGPALTSTRAGLVARADTGRLLARYAGSSAASRGRLPLSRTGIGADSARRSTSEGGTWTRGSGEARYRRGAWAPGVAVDHDWRTQRVGQDSLDAATRGLVEIRPGVRHASRAATVGLDLVVRREWLPRQGGLADAGQGAGLAATWALAPAGTFRADGRATVRRTRYRDGFSGPDGTRAADAVAIDQTLRWAPLRRALDLSMGYEAQTERRPVQQEVYVRVSPDLAEARYVWRDANGNGAREIDEFVLEGTPYEGEYARTFVATDALRGVATVRARARAAVDPSRLNAPAWLRPLTLRATLDVDEQSTARDAWRLYVLDLSRFLTPGLTVNGRLRTALDASLWREHRRGGLDVGVALARSLAGLASGTEARRLLTFRGEGRYRPSDVLLARLVATSERTEAESDRFASRRYRIDALGLDGGLAWQPRPSATLTAGAVAGRRSDAVANRRADLLRVPLDARVSVGRRFVASGTLEASFVRLTGAAEGEAAYELTDGRGPGRSALWTAQLQGALTRTLSLSLAYDGRAPQDAPRVHTLRVQATAAF